MKKLFSVILVICSLLSGNAYADEISFICQDLNNSGGLLQEKDLYEIRNNEVFEDSYKLDDVKDLKISDNIISYKRENSYHKVNLLTGNSYRIYYESNGGATTYYAKCIKF